MLATDRAARTISFDALKQPLSPLFRDYFASRGKASEFYPLGFSREDMTKAAAATAAFAHPRAEVAEALAREQPEGSEARANAEALKDPKTLAVVTGQQSVLFGGPLYVLYKALAAMELARHMSESLKTTVVPVFWVASDDHDFAEIRATTHDGRQLRAQDPALRAGGRAEPPARVHHHPRPDHRPAREVGARPAARLALARRGVRRPGRGLPPGRFDQRRLLEAPPALPARPRDHGSGGAGAQGADACR